jgi:hypothetical protein
VQGRARCGGHGGLLPLKKVPQKFLLEFGQVSTWIDNKLLDSASLPQQNPALTAELVSSPGLASPRRRVRWAPPNAGR